MVNAILARRVNHIVAKGDNPVWPKGSKSRGFSKAGECGWNTPILEERKKLRKASVKPSSRKPMAVLDISPVHSSFAR